MIVPLNLPKAPLKLSRRGEDVYVWCEVRRKKLVCTPEEWVRQHVIHYLNTEYNIPFSLMSTEHRLNYNGRDKRADIVVFSVKGQPELMVECKAPHVPLNEEVLFQIAQYQKVLNAKNLMLTNGIDHLFAMIDKDIVLQTESLRLEEK